MKLPNLFAALPAESIVCQSIPDPNLKIRQVCLLTLNSIAFTPNTLYISNLSTFLSLECHHAPSVFLLVADQDSIPKEKLPSSYILCAPTVEEDQLFTLAMTLLHVNEHVAESKLTISQALFDGVSIGGLIDITAHLIDNPILLQDATTRLLAHSRLEKDFSVKNDEILNCVLSQGFVSADLFQKYDYANVLKSIEMTPQAYILTSEIKSSRILCRLNVNRKYFGWICAIAHNHEFREGDQEIIDYLSGALTILLERENMLPSSSQVERLLQELLSPHSYTEASFKKRAAGFSWALKDHYYVVVLSPEASPGDKTHRTIMAYKNHLSLLFPRMISFLFKEQLILFFDVQHRKVIDETLQPFLKKTRLLGACSDAFTNILEFPDRYRQASSILEIGVRLKRDERLFYFDDLWLYYWIRQIRQFDKLEYLCMPELLKVFRYDTRYGTSYADTVRVLLESASLTAASQKLHIHRNTLLYRLEKFSELTDLNLDDMQIRYHLWSSFMILDLYPELLNT